MKKNPADRLLRDHALWLRMAWPLGLAAAGLAVTLAAIIWKNPSLGKMQNWGTLPAFWIAGIALTGLASLTIWWIRHRNLAYSARHLDRRLAAKNRLETATEHEADPSPLALAQREETAAFLRQVPTARPRRTALLLLFSLAALLLLTHVVFVTLWWRPWIASAGTGQSEKDKTPTANLQWKSPVAETQASSVEEVPLKATAVSSSGLRDLALEIAVNGTPRLTLPLDPGELGKAGNHAIETSLYLDQLEVKPYDMVSYYLRAQRIDGRKLPITTSPIQFVQIKPFRDDVQEVPGGKGNPSLALVKALKVAQLRLLKENFILAHADIDHAKPSWKNENDRVGREQGVLVQKTRETIDKLIAGGEPAEIINLLGQAQPEMTAASEKIQATENTSALTNQGKSLGFITEVEKFYIKQVAKNGSAKDGPPDVKDPFERNKELELKQRFKTQAGELEVLAAEQGRLAGDLTSPSPVPETAPNPDEKPDPDKITGTLSERQTQLSQRAGALLNGQVFTPEITGHIEKGRDLARTSLGHLDGKDLAAAREPATTAAREFQLAVDAMNRAGEQKAREELARAMDQLGEAAEGARNAPNQPSDAASQKAAEEAEEKARQTARELAAAAQAQQEAGSEKAAQRIKETAIALTKEDVAKALDRLRNAPRDAALANDAADRLQEIANLAGKNGKSGPLTPQEMASLVAQLERTRTNLQRLAAVQKNDGQAQGQGQGQGQGMGMGQGPGMSHSQATAALSHDTPPGSSTSNTSAGAARSQYLKPNPRVLEERERFGQELVEDLRSLVFEAKSATPKAADTGSQLQRALGETYSKSETDWNRVVTAIDPPLEGLIALLRGQIKQSQREFHLTDQDIEFAPPAYRSAVSDYFERLSRDYKESPKEGGTAK